MEYLDPVCLANLFKRSKQQKRYSGLILMEDRSHVEMLCSELANHMLDFDISSVDYNDQHGIATLKVDNSWVRIMHVGALQRGMAFHEALVSDRAGMHEEHMGKLQAMMKRYKNNPAIFVISKEPEDNYKSEELDTFLSGFKIIKDN